MKSFRHALAALAALALLALPNMADAQTANGKVTTAAPTYTNNTAAPLSIDTLGGLRVNCTSGCSGSGNSNAQATTAAPSYTNATSNPLSMDLSGNLRTVPNGNVASGATDAGNPLKIGGVVSTAAPGAITTGQRVDAWYSDSGAAIVGGISVAGLDTVANASLATLATSNSASLRLLANSSFLFNGTTWDRQRGDTNGAYAQGNVASGTADAGNPLKIGGVATALIPSSVANGSRVDAWYNPIGAVVVAAATRVNLDGSGNTGSGFMGNNSTTGAGQAIATYPYVYNGTTWDRQRGDTNGTAVIPPVQNGSLNHSAILAATTNSTNVKNAAGIITEISVYNSSATIAWLKLYDVAAAPTCGTGTPVGRYMIPGASAGGAGSNVTISLGKNFATGISYCVTTGIADADTGAVAAATYTVNFSYR